MKYSVLLFVILLFVGCHSYNSDNPFSKMANGTLQANQVIDYYNQAFDRYQTYNNSYLQAGTEYLESVAEFIEKKASNPLLKKPFEPFYMLQTPPPSPLEAPVGLGTQRDSIAREWQIMENSVQEMRKQVQQIVKYATAEDFKDDNGKLLEQVRTQNLEQIVRYRDASEKFFALINPIVEQAEAYTLDKNPLKEPILSFKRLLTQADEFLEIVELQSENGKFEVATLEELYQKITQEATKSKKLTIATEDAKRKVFFDEFNRETENFLGAARRLLRALKEKQSFTGDDYQLLSAAYQRMINSYNDFID